MIEEPRFSPDSDWFSNNIPNWRLWLSDMAGCPSLQGLEIGTYEGRASIWLLNNVFTDTFCWLRCIDHVKQPNWSHNLDGDRRVSFEKSTSREYLASMNRHRQPGAFDFIYIDGSHRAVDVLSDAVLAWPLLRVGGVLIFDDYLWTGYGPAEDPKIAIDSFLATMAPYLERLPEAPDAPNPGWQVAIKKVRSEVHDFSDPNGKH